MSETAQVPAVQAPVNTALAQAFDYGDQRAVGFEGVQTTDLALPFLTVLQALSPEVSGDAGQKVPGAEAGSLFNTVTNEVAKSVIVQPVSQKHVFVEWRPRTAGGGYVAAHDPASEIVTNAVAKAEKFGKYKTDAGNDLVETYYVLCLVHRSVDIAEQASTGQGEPVLITFQSTKITPWKKMLMRMLSVVGRPPMFAHRIQLTTVLEKRTQGSSYNFVLNGVMGNDLKASLIPPTTEEGKKLLMAAFELNQAFKNGLVNVNFSKSANGGSKAPSAGDGKDDDIPF